MATTIPPMRAANPDAHAAKPALNPSGSSTRNTAESVSREYLCHGQKPHPKNQGVPEPQNRIGHGLQADDVSKEKIAKDPRVKPSARDHSGRCLPPEECWRGTMPGRKITPEIEASIGNDACPTRWTVTSFFSFRTQFRSIRKQLIVCARLNSHCVGPEGGESQCALVECGRSR